MWGSHHDLVSLPPGSPLGPDWSLALTPGCLSASVLVSTFICFLTDLISWLLEGPGESVFMRLKRKQEEV